MPSTGLVAAREDATPFVVPGFLLELPEIFEGRLGNALAAKLELVRSDP